jgi:ribosomal protein L16 Arg81 hydroxylase
LEEIELSVMMHTPETARTLQAMLDEFKSQTGIKVNLTCLDWVTAHAELNKAALVSIGSQVISSPPEAFDEILEREVENVTHRVEMILSQ